MNPKKELTVGPLGKLQVDPLSVGAGDREVAVCGR